MLHESQASYFKAACDTSPSACPQSYSATRVLPLSAPSFFCSTTPLSNSSPAMQGSLTFSLVSWSPLYLLALTAFILAVYQSFSQHTFIPEEEFWCPLLDCLISLLQVVSLTWTSLTMPPVFLKILCFSPFSEYAKSPSLIFSPLSPFIPTRGLSDLIYFQG